MVRLVHGTAHPAELPLEVGHVLAKDPEIVRCGARLLGQRLLDLDAPRALGVAVLLGAPQPALALGDLVTQPVGLIARPHQLVVDPGDLGVQGADSRLGVGGAPPCALGRELRAAQLSGLEQLRLWTLRNAVAIGALTATGDHDIPDRERHHHGPELQERLPGQLGRELRRHRETHPPRPRRRAQQRRRLWHRDEPLPGRPVLDHEHRLAAELGAPAPPPPGHTNRHATPALGHEFHRLDPKGGRHIAHRPRRYGRERTNMQYTTHGALP